MTFIIALGVIIILLCSASVFKLMQPKQRPAKQQRHKRSNTKKQPPAVTSKAKSATPKPQAAPVNQPAAPSKPAFVATHADEVAVAELISLNLRAADDKPYAGYELLQALLSCGMRFGSMNIFHRHQKKTGAGPILFSLASCTQEGTFDLAQIGAFSCKGLVLFMKPKEVAQPAKVFELMLETADELISDLGGKVLNDHQQLLKKDDVLRCHQQLSAYEQAIKTSDLVE